MATSGTRMIAFLRAINLGKNRRFAMADLKECLTEAGFTDVETHLATGNVRFGTRMRSRERLEERLEEVFEARTGFAVPTIAVSPAELCAVHDAAVALDLTAPRRYVTFLKQPLPPEAFSTAPSKRSEPRVPFLSLVEAGLVKAGERVFDEKRRHSATIRADGTLMLGPAVGSIHKVGALAQGLPACNGWTFWHVERDGKALLLDALRGEIRAQLAAA